MYKYVHVPCLVSALRPIPSRPCNVEAFPIPCLGALVRVAHVGWRLVPSSRCVCHRARISLSLSLTHYVTRHYFTRGRWGVGRRDVHPPVTPAAGGGRGDISYSYYIRLYFPRFWEACLR